MGSHLQWVFLLAMAGCSGFRAASLPDGGDLADGASLPDGGVDADASDGSTPDSGWTLVYEDPEAADDEALNALWIADPKNVFAVGDNRQIVHFDGNDWSALVKTRGAHLYGVWGASADAVVAVGIYTSGAKPAIFQYDGELWTSAGPFPPHLLPLTAVWGSGSEHYFVGSDSHVFQDDPINHPTQRYHIASVLGPCSPDESLPILWSIDGSGLDNILTVGDRGVMAHFNGEGWIRLCDPDRDYAFREVFSIPGSTDFYVGGNHLTLKLFRSRSDPVLTIHEDRAIDASHQAYIWSIWGTSSATILAVGDHGTILYYDGFKSARPVPSPTKDTLFSVVGYDEKTVYICGQKNRIWRGSLPTD